MDVNGNYQALLPNGHILRGAPLGGESERAFFAFFTLVSRKHAKYIPSANRPLTQPFSHRSNLPAVVQFSRDRGKGEEKFILAGAFSCKQPARSVEI